MYFLSFFFPGVSLLPSAIERVKAEALFLLEEEALCNIYRKEAEMYFEKLNDYQTFVQSNSKKLAILFLFFTFLSSVSSGLSIFGSLYIL